MTLALMLLMAAAVAAYFAWTLSQPQQPPVIVSGAGKADSETDAAEAEQPEKPVTFDVVFARSAIAAGSTISAEQLIVHALPIEPPHTYADPEAVTGARVWRDIEAGEMLRPGHLRQGSDLATTLLAEERAIAVAVDEVVGIGGLLAPGDSVDVLLYLRESPQDQIPSAQVLLEDIRLLSFAERVQPPPDRASEEEPERTEFRGKTAVLAVPQKDVPRLMLASNAGTLRLALRSADNPAAVIKEDFSVTDTLVTTPLPSGEKEDRAAVVRLSDILPQPERSKPRPQPKPEPEKITIQIHRGDAAETVELPQIQ